MPTFYFVPNDLIVHFENKYVFFRIVEIFKSKKE